MSNRKTNNRKKLASLKKDLYVIQDKAFDELEDGTQKDKNAWKAFFTPKLYAQLQENRKNPELNKYIEGYHQEYFKMREEMYRAQSFNAERDKNIHSMNEQIKKFKHSLAFFTRDQIYRENLLYTMKKNDPASYEKLGDLLGIDPLCATVEVYTYVSKEVKTLKSGKKIHFDVPYIYITGPNGKFRVEALDYEISPHGETSEKQFQIDPYDREKVYERIN